MAWRKPTRKKTRRAKRADFSPPTHLEIRVDLGDSRRANLQPSHGHRLSRGIREVDQRFELRDEEGVDGCVRRSRFSEGLRDEGGVGQEGFVGSSGVLAPQGDGENL